MAATLKGNHLPKEGTVLRIFIPGDVERMGKIISYDSHKEEAYVQWINLPGLTYEWIPTRWL